MRSAVAIGETRARTIRLRILVRLRRVVVGITVEEMVKVWLLKICLSITMREVVGAMSRFSDQRRQTTIPIPITEARSKKKALRAIIVRAMMEDGTMATETIRTRKMPDGLTIQTIRHNEEARPDFKPTMFGRRMTARFWRFWR